MLKVYYILSLNHISIESLANRLGLNSYIMLFL